ncbi:MAG: precorrin-6y C5,15-methyltransferase (decarboxylating) subunit CbiE [Cyanobacteria bacterium RU_5_0]|nr:precorrin-6y C5,15-methyltransferase (decarboxylating) subunit CbiE [Cyanobacteria bacterium RU_5_0]
MAPIYVVGIGLEGAVGLTDSVRQLVEQATLLVGSPRHLSYFPNYEGDRLILDGFREAIATIRHYLTKSTPSDSPIPSSPHLLTPSPSIVILTSGDPLCFGLGRLLLAELPPEQITFYPYLSAIQLAFSRVKVPWQDARIVSVHGRSLDSLTQALQQGAEKIAILTDKTNTPGAIVHHLRSLDLPSRYQVWVCENLGGSDERIQYFAPEDAIDPPFAALNVVILLRSSEISPLDLQSLPTLGLPDQSFLSFSDRPGLMTKREVRLLILGELALRPDQIVWDIGAGTGSVSIEIARLFQGSQIYAIEQTAAGITLIQQNSQRFQVSQITPVHGTAPDALHSLPNPDRIFIGGSGGNLAEILTVCRQMIKPNGVIVLALATLEHLSIALAWLKAQTPSDWQHRLLQVQLSRSVPIASLTRFTPLNPVTLLTLEKS